MPSPDATELRVPDWPALIRTLYSPTFRLSYEIVDELCRQFALGVIARHRLFDGCRTETVDTIGARLKVSPQARYLVGRVLALLAEEQLLELDGDKWIPTGPLPVPEATTWEAAERVIPGEPMCGLLLRCETGMDSFISGERRGVDIIFPRGDQKLWERLHQCSNLMSGYARLGGSVASAALPEGGALFEFGGGTGAGTITLLERLEGRRFSAYTFSDVSHFFVERAKRRFAARACMRFTTFNLNETPQSQRIPLRSYDVVYGVNAAHLAQDLSRTLGYLRDLVRPGGWLVLAEGAPPSAQRMWRPDLVFGFLEGWWNIITDSTYRPRPGFLTFDEWRRLLINCGFGSIVTLPLEHEVGGPSFGGVIAAHVPATPKGKS